MTLARASGPPKPPGAPEGSVRTVPDTPPFTIAADIDLGVGAAPWMRRHGADVTIRRGDVPDALANAESKGVAWAWARGRLLFRLPRGLRLLVEGGERIRWAAESGLAEADVRLFVLETALPALVLHRGLLALRASAVASGHDVHAFGAPPRWGKSTLAAGLSGRGFPFFADNVLVVDPARGEGEARCWRCDDLKLGPRGIAAVGLGDHERKPVRKAEGYKKQHVAPHARSPRMSGLLRTAHFLGAHICPPDDEDRMGFERVAGLETTRLLWTMVFQAPIAVSVLGQEELFRRVIALARHVQVHRFGIPLSDDAEWLPREVNAVAERLSASA